MDDDADLAPVQFATIPEGRVRDRRKWRGSGAGQPIALAAAILLALVAVWAVASTLGPGRWLHPRDALSCPRPPWPSEGQPQFNEQQRQIRELRRLAFHGDFFAELELARRYEGRRTSDKNLQDQVEASVWYALALANPDGYERTGTRDHRWYEPTPVSLYDDCRHGERGAAYRELDRLLSQMSTEEQDKVRNRATYVLSTEGATGLRTLGRLHDVAFGPFGEPVDDVQARYAFGPHGWPDAARLFERNAVDAYMFDYLALQTGDQGAYVLLQDLQRSAPAPGFSDIAESRARRWVPPYEFYPPDSPESGVPHSDESGRFDEPDRIAQDRIRELPFVHIAEALTYLHVIPHPVASEHELSTHDIQTFQAMLGRPATGWLTSLEKVRAIQYAAVNGSPHAQLVLAVMYAQGVGVGADYARAFHWFQEADRQGSPEAKFAIATYFSEGLAGVANQEKAEAVVHQLDAALSGFRPSIGRLRAMLERVSPGRRDWNFFARPDDPGPYDGYGPTGDASGPPPDGQAAPPPPGDAGGGPYDGASAPAPSEESAASHADRHAKRRVVRAPVKHKPQAGAPQGGAANDRGTR
jgi:TPR repeat protein